MVSDKRFFHIGMLQPLKVNKHCQTLIIFKNKLNHQLNIVILKYVAHYEMFCEVFFFLHNFISSQFLILPEVFYTN